jgi:hypothetical protein
MGIEPFLVSSSTIGVIAQRLARRLCQECREPYAPDAETRRFFGLAEAVTLYRGRGCSRCAGKGVKGRIGIYEVMRMTPALRQLVSKGAPAEELHAAAVAGGMVDLKAYAVRLLVQGADVGRRSHQRRLDGRCVNGYGHRKDERRKSSKMLLLLSSPTRHFTCSSHRRPVPLEDESKCEDLERSRSQWRAH